MNLKKKTVISLALCLLLSTSLVACSNESEEKPVENTTGQNATKPAEDMHTKATEEKKEEAHEEKAHGEEAEEAVDVEEESFEEEDVEEEQGAVKEAASWTDEVEEKLAEVYTKGCATDANTDKFLASVKKADKKEDFCGCFGEKVAEGWKETFPDVKELKAKSKDEVKAALQEHKVGQKAVASCSESALSVKIK